MYEYEKYNGKRGFMLIFICLFIVLIIPCLYIYQSLLLYGLDKHLYNVIGGQFDMKFYDEKDVLPIITLINLIKLNQIFEIFYFVFIILIIPLSMAVNGLKAHMNVKKSAKVIYAIMIVIVSAVSGFIVFTNLHYFSGIIMVRYSTAFYICYATICNILGLSFCILMWSKFFDDVVLICKSVMCRVRKITAVRKK